MKNLITALSIILTTSSPLFAQEPSFSTAFAKTINEGLTDCGYGSRISAVGEITTDNGMTRTVPARTQFETGPKAADLFNECGV